jgi:CRISPR system Cascade subunit CasD
MPQFVLLTLAAPMASFGGLAVGERRPSGDHPTKSQIVGLVAAALGIPRVDEERQAALAASLGFAVRVDEAGQPASDYHTAQAAKDASIRKRVRTHGALATRRDELACEDIKTVLSMREYRMSVLATVVLWLRQDGPNTLEAMRSGLVAPLFALYLGRKSFPLMLPCRPEIVAADTIEDALGLYHRGRSDDLSTFEATVLHGRLPRHTSSPVLYADTDAPTRLKAARTHTLRDAPESRAKWGFRTRTENVLTLPTEGDAP